MTTPRTQLRLRILAAEWFLLAAREGLGSTKTSAKDIDTHLDFARLKIREAEQLLSKIENDHQEQTS